MTQEKKWVITYNSFWLAFFANTACINQILISLDPGLAGSAMTMLFILETIALFVSAFFLQRKKCFSANKKNVMFAVCLLVFFFFSRSLIGETHIKPSMFLVLTIVSFLIPQLVQINTRIALISMIIMSTPSVLFHDVLFALNTNGDLDMGMSYVFMLPGSASLMFLFVYLKQESFLIRILLILACSVNLYTAFYVIQYGSRGPSLNLLAVCLFLLVVIVQDNRLIVKKGLLKIFVIGIILLYFSFVPVLSCISDFLYYKYNLRVNFIDKFLSFDDQGLSMTNGRDEIYGKTLQGIYESPLFGHGFDRFDANTGLEHPHNFLLQIAYDFGLVVLVVFVLCLLVKLINTFKKYQKDKFVIVWFLFFASVPGALFSSSIWQNSLLWLFFGCLFSNTIGYVSKK